MLSRDVLLAARLRALPLFAALDDDDARALAKAGVRKTLRKRQRLYGRGERGDALVVVLAGRIDVVRATARGERAVLRTFTAGALLGLSVIAGAAHTADLVAAEASEVLLVAGRDVRALFAKRPELPLAIIRALGDLVAALSDDVSALRDDDLDTRVRKKVAQLGQGRREIRVTHAELAAMVGATRANTSRALERLERTGVVRLARGRIELV
jgi:CRP/FNR family cyclic AMP-dependent transcriptional regulator